MYMYIRDGTRMIHREVVQGERARERERDKEREREGGQNNNKHTKRTLDQGIRSKKCARPYLLQTTLFLPSFYVFHVARSSQQAHKTLPLAGIKSLYTKHCLRAGKSTGVENKSLIRTRLRFLEPAPGEHVSRLATLA